MWISRKALRMHLVKQENSQTKNTPGKSNVTVCYGRPQTIPFTGSNQHPLQTLICHLLLLKSWGKSTSPKYHLKQKLHSSQVSRKTELGDVAFSILVKQKVTHTLQKVYASE